MDLNADVLTRKNVVYLTRHLVLALSIVLAIELLEYLLNIKEPDSSKLKDAFMSNFLFSFFGAVLIAPIYEEVVFRLALKKSNYYWFSVFLTFVFVLSSKFMLTQIVCSLFIVGMISYQYVYKSNSSRCFLIILSILAFVSVHFDNYNENELNELGKLDVAMLFVPQLVLAVFLTKIRLETSILNSIIFHSFYNLLILSLALLFDF